MSKMKKFRAFIAAMLAAAALLLSVSCDNGTQTEQTQGSESTESEASYDPDTLVLFKNGVTEYSIVYPESPDGKVFSAVRELQQAFVTCGGIRPEIKEEGTDVPAGANDGAYEILVGKTQRPESQRAESKLTDRGGYSVTRDGNKLVIYANTAQMTEKAVKYFISTYLTASSSGTASELLFTSENDYEYVRVGLMTSVTVCGKELESFRIVVPKDGYIEQYTAELFADYLFSYYGGRTPLVVTDDKAATDNEIIIGKTSRTTVKVQNGEYKIVVTDKGIQAVSDSVTGYLDVLDTLKKAIPSSESRVELSEGDVWSGSAGRGVSTSESDISVMYHNILGYVSNYPASNRPAMTLQIYLEYRPQVIGLQEFGQTYYRAYAKTLTDGLSAAGYKEICFKNEGGTGNPIFYDSASLTLMDSGYDRARSGDKGTTWAVFKDANGRIFAVTNSHFAANSNAGGNADKGNQYRVEDAQTLLNVINGIKGEYSDIPIIVGGDFNSSMSSDPGKTLKQGGLTHATDIAAKSADYSAWIGYPVYNSEKDYYMPRSFVWANIAGALDHVMLGGAVDKLDVLEYGILKDKISCVVSDHLPQILYVDWK